MTKNLDCSNDIEICLPFFDGQDFLFFSLSRLDSSCWITIGVWTNYDPNCSSTIVSNQIKTQMIIIIWRDCLIYYLSKIINKSCCFVAYRSQMTIFFLIHWWNVVKIYQKSVVQPSSPINNKNVFRRFKSKEKTCWPNI